MTLIYLIDSNIVAVCKLIQVANSEILVLSTVVS